MTRFIVFTTGLFFLSLTAFSQGVTLQEMINKVECPDYNCFNDFIIKKGFYEKKVDPVGGMVKFQYLYRSDSTYTATSNPKVMARHNDVTFSCIDGLPRVAILTVVNMQYQNLMDELSSFNFKTTKTTDIGNGSIEVEYKSNSYPKTIVLVTTKNSIRKSDNENFTTYIIEVWGNYKCQ